MAEASGNFFSAFGKLGIIIISAAMFVLGLVGTVYLSLRSPEVQVPDVVNKTYNDGTTVLSKAGLDISERAQRYKPDVQPGMILDQTPHAGEVVKSGQTVRVVVSRNPREGEQPPPVAEVAEDKKGEGAKGSKNDNAAESKTASKNENRERRNKNTNKNANGNGNLNANSRNLNNNNNAATRNTNGGNANRNGNRNQNGNVNSTLNLNRNKNTNSRNSNTNANRNTNTVRANGNVNRHP